MEDHHERVRATTNFYFSLVLFCGFSLALIPAFISERSDILIIPVFSGFIFSVLLLFANKYIRSSKVIGLIFILLGLSVAFGNLFFNTEVLHIGAPLWILLVILYSFYNVGVLWSIIVSLASFAVYVVWIVYFLNDEVSRVATDIQETTPLLVLEVSIAFIMLIAMVLVFMNAIYSKERQLTLKNNQMLLKQQAVDEESRNYAKQVSRSTENIHKYFETASNLISENKSSEFLHEQLRFSSVVFKIFALQGRHKDNEPGILITSTLSKVTATFSEDKKINYTVDNTIDFIEEQHIFPVCMILTMLVYETCQCDDAENIAVNYFFENGEVVLRYQDDCEHPEHEGQEERVQLSNIILSDVGARFVANTAKKRTHVDLRFPL